MKLRPFELALVIIFGVLGILALILLSSYDKKPDSDPDNQPVTTQPVTIWGTLPAEPINTLLWELAEDNESYSMVSYRYYEPTAFDNALVNALADGEGPDLVLVSHEKLVDLRRRIQPRSYESFASRDFQNLYLDGAQLFARSDGIYGYPIGVDPLMLYWNRDILTNAGYLEPPNTWETLVNKMFPELIKRDFDRTIERSVVAMGEYSNVQNAYGIISMLLLQGGSRGVVEHEGPEYEVQLRTTPSGSGDPLGKAADFYTRFSKPSNALYSWNRSFDEDRQQFIAGDLAFYFGYGSEGPLLERLNPNLRFDIAEVPQSASANVRRTYGKFYALSMMQATANPSGASMVMANLGGVNMASEIARRSDLVPAHRSTVAQGSNDIYGRVTYQSAPITYGWLNPNKEATAAAFATMTRDINENRRELSGAAGDAAARIANEFKK